MLDLANPPMTYVEQDNNTDDQDGLEAFASAALAVLYLQFRKFGRSPL
jgi:hypothetical protein